MTTFLKREFYAGAFQRARALLLKPKETWPVIADETWSVTALATGYLLIIATAPVLLNGVMAAFRGVGIGQMIPLLIAYIARNVVATLAVGLASAWIAKQLEIEITRDVGLKLVAFSATALFAARLIGAVLSGLPMDLIGYAGFIYLALAGIPLLTTAPAGKGPLLAGALALSLYAAMALLTMLVAPASGGRISAEQALQEGAVMQQGMADQAAAFRCMQGIGHGCGGY